MDLLSNAQAARLLGVSTATVKRWADDGLLPCVRTAGRHRRFERQALEALRARHAGTVSGRAPETVGLPGELLSSSSALHLEAILLRERARAGSWWPVVDALELALLELRRRWHAGVLSLLEVRVTGQRLDRALARISDVTTVAADAPRCMLVSAEGEDRTSALSLVEPCLRERGWNTVWAGHRVPISTVARAIKPMPLRAIVLHASDGMRKPERLAAQVSLLVNACRVHGVQLVLLGRADWPQHESVVVATRIAEVQVLG